MKYRISVNVADTKFLIGYLTNETVYSLDGNGPVSFGTKKNAKEFLLDDVNEIVKKLTNAAKERLWTVWNISIEGIL